MNENHYPTVRAVADMASAVGEELLAQKEALREQLEEATGIVQTRDDEVAELQQALHAKMGEVTALLDNEQVLNARIAELEAMALRDATYIRDIRDKVYEFFDEEFESDDNTIVVTRDEANDLLDSIGCDTLAREYEVTLEVQVRMTVTARSEDEATCLAERALNIDSDDSDVEFQDYDVTSSSADEQ